MRTLFLFLVVFGALWLDDSPAVAGVLDAQRIAATEWNISVELQLHKTGATSSPISLTLFSDGVLHNTAVSDSAPWRITPETAKTVLSATSQYLDGLHLPVRPAATNRTLHRCIQISLIAGEFSIHYTTPHLASLADIPPELHRAINLMLAADPALRARFDQQWAP